MWTVDWGGTRTKIAWWSEGEIKHGQSFPSPNRLDLVLDRLRPAGPLALSLPGRVPLPFEEESLWRYGAGHSREMGGAELFEKCLSRGLELRLVINDVAAAGFGAAWGETAYVAQLSTGCAMRLFIDGKLVLLGKDPALLDLAFQEEYEGKVFYDWLRREKRWFHHDWLETSFDEREKAADIFTLFIESGLKRGPDAGVYLLGGGAAVLRGNLQARLQDRILGFPDPALTSMRGLYLLRDGIPTVQSQF